MLTRYLDLPTTLLSLYFIHFSDCHCTSFISLFYPLFFLSLSLSLSPPSSLPFSFPSLPFTLSLSLSFLFFSSYQAGWLVAVLVALLLAVQLPQPGAPLSVLDQADLNLLKGQCHAIVNPFFCSKDSAWAPYEEAKTVLQTFSFLRRYLSVDLGPNNGPQTGFIFLISAVKELRFLKMASSVNK